MSALAVALSFDDLNAGQSLQRHVPKNLSRHFADVVHSVTPFSRPETRRESGTMSCEGLPKTLGERVAFALWRRLNSGALTRKHLQIALDVSSGTIDNLLNGRSDPSGRVLDGLVALMRAEFVNEVWGHHNVVCMCRTDERKAALLRRIEEAQVELQKMERL